MGVGEGWKNITGSLEVSGTHYTCTKLPNNNGDDIDKNKKLPNNNGSCFTKEHSSAGGFAVCI